MAFDVCKGHWCARPVSTERTSRGFCSKCRAGLGVPTWHNHLINGTWGGADYVFDLRNLAQLLTSSGLVKKTFMDMTRDDITFLCEAVLSSVIPETDPVVVKSYWQHKEKTTC